MTDSELADKHLTDYKDKIRQGTHIPSLGREPVAGQTTEVCDAWPCNATLCVRLPSQPQGITAP